MCVQMCVHKCYVCCLALFIVSKNYFYNITIIMLEQQLHILGINVTLFQILVVYVRRCASL